jgi:tetratricopeptide (TPR) repeat protein
LETIDAALADGEHDRAGEAAAMLAQDVACEPAHLRAVQALYMAGRVREALAAAQERIALLQSEFGSDPSAEFLHLLQTVQQAADRAPPAQVPVSVLRPPRLVGRDRELARLAQARASGRVPLLIGEPGLGKSRLLAEHVGVGEAVVACRPGDAGVPFGALTRWLRGLRTVHPQALEALPPALAVLLPECAVPPAARDGGDVTAATAEVLARALAGGLAGLAVDDLHFADAASIEALAVLIDTPRLEALRWALSRRPAEGNAALDRLADALLDGGALVAVRLVPLDAQGMRELLSSLALPGLDDEALADELLQATGGNPMFALETLKLLIQQPAGPRARLPRPPNVTALVERRLRQLSPLALSLARVAALAGPDFDARLAAQVLALPVLVLADAWQELEGAQVVREQAFAHDLIYEATLASIPAPVQRHTRRAIAAHLSAHGGEPASAAPHFAAAGRLAEAAARYDEARQLLEQAAACQDAAGEPGAAFETRLALADLLMERAEFEPSLRVLDALAASSIDPDQRLCVVMQRMQVMGRNGSVHDAIRLGEQTLADPALQEDVTPMHLAQLRWTLASSLRTAGNGDAALVQLALAEPLLADAADATWRCWFHSQRAQALLLCGRLADADQAQAFSIVAAREVGRHRMLAGCLQNGSTLATNGGRIVEAVGMLDECLSLMAETGGSDAFTQRLRVQRARTLVWLGRYEEALGVLEPLSEAAASLADYNHCRVLASLAELWTHLGQRHRAQRMLGALAEIPKAAFEQQIVALTTEEVAWLRDDPPAPGLAEIFLPEVAPSAPNLALSQLMAWRRCTSRDDLDAAVSAATAWRERGLLGHALVADVIVAAGRAEHGDLVGAARHAGLALAGMRRLGAPGIYRPSLFLALAEATGELEDLRARALRDGVAWVRNIARFQVPVAYRTGFLQGNRVNRALLSKAGD